MNVGSGLFSPGIDVAVYQDHHHNPEHSNNNLQKHNRLPTSAPSREASPVPISSPSWPTRDLAKRVYLTIALYLAFIGMGFNGGIHGPSLVHLEYLFNTDTSGISKMFIGLNLGFLIGTLLCAVMFDRFNHEMQFSLYGMISGICSICCTWVPGIYYYYVVVTLQYIAQGVVFSGGQSYVLKLWQDYGKKGPTLIVMYLCWSLGAFLAPFVAIPFLEDLDELNSAATAKNISIHDDHVIRLNKTAAVSSGDGEESIHYTDERTLSLSGVHKVKYIYAIVGFINVFAAILFFIGFLINGPSCLNKLRKIGLETDSGSCKSSNNAPDKSTLQEKCKMGTESFYKRKIFFYKGIILGLVWLFAVLYFWHDHTIGNYISVFCLKGLKWPVGRSALITSIFYGFFCISRVIGLVLTKFISPGKMLILNICLTTIGLVLLLFSQYSNIVVWIGTSLAGFGMSTTSPTYVLWTSNYMTISGPIGAMFMAGCGFGSMTSGWLVGHMFQEYTHMWVVYISLGSCIVNIFIFVLLTIVGRLLQGVQKIMEDVGNSEVDVGQTSSKVVSGNGSEVTRSGLDFRGSWYKGHRKWFKCSRKWVISELNGSVSNVTGSGYKVTGSGTIMTNIAQ